MAALLVATPASAFVPPTYGKPAKKAGASFLGKWKTTWGEMWISAFPPFCIGGYQYGATKGTLVGEVEGATLRFQWTENSLVGRGVFVLQSDGRSFVGTWGKGTSETDGGDWDGERAE